MEDLILKYNKKQVLSKLYLYFQDKAYDLKNIPKKISYYEYLPGVYIKHNLSIFSDIQVMKIKIINKRDLIVIEQEKEKVFEQYPSNSSKDIYDFKRINRDACNESYIKNKLVNINDIAYPEVMGGFRCPLEFVLKKYLGNNFEYKFLNTTQKCEVSKRLKRHCLNQKYECSEILKKFQQNTYKYKGNEDDIVLYEIDGKYLVANGNHRICCAKTFENIKVPVDIIKLDRKNADVYHKGFKFVNNSNAKVVLESFYRGIIEFGLDKEDASEVLGIKNNFELIRFIENKNSYKDNKI